MALVDMHRPLTNSPFPHGEHFHVRCNTWLIFVFVDRNLDLERARIIGVCGAVVGECSVLEHHCIQFSCAKSSTV